MARFADPAARRPASRRQASRRRRLTLAVSLTTLLAVSAASCGGGGGSADDVPSGSGGDSMAARGERTARANGCAGCHGQDFDGAAGPGWFGLAGSEVTLVDGSTVVADDAYLTRAIADPGAELVDGYTLKMPANSLTDTEVAEIVAYINSLADR